MYKIIFYKDKNGKSETKDFIESLYKSKNKNSRINFKKIQDYMNALQMHGLALNDIYIKHLEDKIWEIRPIRNRILFAAYNGEYFIVLSHFLKKTQKTPQREIEKAKKRFKDFLERIDEHE